MSENATRTDEHPAGLVRCPAQLLARPVRALGQLVRALEDDVFRELAFPLADGGVIWMRRWQDGLYGGEDVGEVDAGPERGGYCARETRVSDGGSG